MKSIAGALQPIVRSFESFASLPYSIARPFNSVADFLYSLADFSK